MANFWDEEVLDQQHQQWMALPRVRDYINRRIGNGEFLWPMDLFARYLQGRTFERALSIGCGSGALERDLVLRGICKSVDAFDASLVSLAIARREAERLGYHGRIRYFAADFNEPIFPKNHYDIVFFHQSAHHVKNLERLFRWVNLTLKPGGLVYLDEYVGPSRFDWEEHPELMDAPRRAFDATPASTRATQTIAPPVHLNDPTEAIRSSEIETQLQVGFRLIGKQEYGGGILSVVLPQLKLDALDEAMLSTLIEHDRRAPSFYTLLLATPKKGVTGAIAQLRYIGVPRLKRLAKKLT